MPFFDDNGGQERKDNAPDIDVGEADVVEIPRLDVPSCVDVNVWMSVWKWEREWLCV